MLLGAAGSVLALPLLVSGEPDRTAPQSAVSSGAPNAKKALQNFKQADDYGLYIGGVSDGVLQSVWIAQQIGANTSRLILARTATQQTGQKGAIYFATTTLVGCVSRSTLAFAAKCHSRGGCPDVGLFEAGIHHLGSAGASTVEPQQSK